MITYKVTAPMGVTINQGKVGLTKEQHRRRAHAVTAVAGAEGIYEVNKPVMFKNGEEFSYTGSVSKGMADQLIDKQAGKTVAELNIEAEAAKKEKAKKDAAEKDAREKAKK